MDIFISGKMTSKGQVTIPSDLRNTLNLAEGDKLQFILKDDGELVVMPQKKKSIYDVTSVLNIKVGEEDWNVVRSKTQEQIAERNKL